MDKKRSTLFGRRKHSNTNITFKEHLKVLESNVLSKSEINLECNTLLNFKFGGGDGMRMLNKPPWCFTLGVIYSREGMSGGTFLKIFQ